MSRSGPFLLGGSDEDSVECIEGMIEGDRGAQHFYAVRLDCR